MLNTSLLTKLLALPTQLALPAVPTLADQAASHTAALISTARADRLAHTPMWTVAGPGVHASWPSYNGARSFVLETHARRFATRLDIEHGLGTHTVTGPDAEVA